MSASAGAVGAGEWLRGLWAQRQQAHGLWCSLPSSRCTELVAACSPDFLVIDCQHGFFDHRDLLAALQGAGRYPGYPLIRVARNESHLIGAALDAGAAGVIVPMIEDRKTARTAAAACRYPPSGLRSYGPGRSALVVPGTPAQVNAAVLGIALIETAVGVRHADEICAEPGIDAVMIGAADLAVDLGVPVSSRENALREAIAEVVAAADRADLPVMIGAADQPTEHGATLVIAATDAAILQTGALAALDRARAAERQSG